MRGSKLQVQHTNDDVENNDNDNEECNEINVGEVRSQCNYKFS